MKDYPELSEIEVADLKKKIFELEAKVKKYEEVLEDNDLLEEPKTLSIEELICLNEIDKLKIVSDKGCFTLEDTKIFDLLVKNLLAIRGKAPIKEDSKKKVKGPVQVADLLKIVNGDKK